jgi:hypothetical protein
MADHEPRRALLHSLEMLADTSTLDALWTAHHEAGQDYLKVLTEPHLAEIRRYDASVELASTKPVETYGLDQLSDAAAFAAWRNKKSEGPTVQDRNARKRARFIAAKRAEGADDSWIHFNLIQSGLAGLNGR